MIQRIQTIWLLLAAAGSLLTLKFPIYSGQQADGLFGELNGQSGFLHLLLTVGVALLALMGIFLYKKRKTQALVALGGLALQLLQLVLLYTKTADYTQGNYSLTAVIYLLTPVFFVLAWLGIRKDEKLVRSMDRLR